MSPEGMDPGAIWQDPPARQRKPVQQKAQSVEEEAMAAQAQQQFTDDAPQFVEEEEEEEEEAAAPAEYLHVSSSSERAERFKALGQQATPVLVPLLFGGLTSLFVLPLIAEHRASVAPDNIWLIVAIILIVTIAQIITLFYAGANNSIWAVATLGGFFLFLLIGSFAIFGSMVGFIVLLALATLSVLLARRYFHAVPEGFVDIVSAFGKYSRTLYAGPNVLFPWEKVTHKIKVKEIQWLCPMQRVQLSPDHDVVLRAIISYQLLPEEAHIAITQVERWEESLRELFITTLQTVATAFLPDDFISWPEGLQTPPIENENTDLLTRREDMNNYLYRQVRDKAALWGIIVHWVHMRDIMLAPHDTEIHPEVLMPPSTTAEPADQTLPKITPPSQQPVSQRVGNAPNIPEQEPGAASPPNPAPEKLLSEEVLVKVYKEVQDGKITDPQTIREIAASFKAVADDPVASQAVNFDADRAAANLYEQAEKYRVSIVSKRRK